MNDKANLVLYNAAPATWLDIFSMSPKVIWRWDATGYFMLNNKENNHEKYI